MPDYRYIVDLRGLPEHIPSENIQQAIALGTKVDYVSIDVTLKGMITYPITVVQDHIESSEE